MLSSRLLLFLAGLLLGEVVSVSAVAAEGQGAARQPLLADQRERDGEREGVLVVPPEQPRSAGRQAFTEAAVVGTAAGAVVVPLIMTACSAACQVGGATGTG